MKIIQIADLHIGEKVPDTNVARFLMDNVACELQQQDQVAVCVCGDIIDKGSKGRIQEKYQNAKVVFNTIKSALDKIECEYQFMLVPGNHDIAKKSSIRRFFEGSNSLPFEYYCKFASEITGNSIYHEFNDKQIICLEFGGFNWILANSAHHANTEYGEIGDHEIQNAINNAEHPSVVLMHHSLLADGGDDQSTLRNGYRVIRNLENKAIAILHGHTHGFKNIKIGNTCLVVGVGPFYKEVSEINKQLNLISLNSQGVTSIKNFYYRSDLEDQHIMSLELYHFDGNTVYNNHELRPLINQVRSDIEQQTYLHNISIHYQSTIEKMDEEIKKHYQSELTIASEWQEPECPNVLYYNHGSIISKLSSKEYILQKLRDNPTSRRAMISLISQADVQKSKPDGKNRDEYLPSFDIVQFSFPQKADNELVVSLYMRALEVSYFLPVNFCELFLLIEYLRDNNLPIARVNITIFAHRATEIKGFYGFRKAKIDMLSKEEMDTLIQRQEYNHIIEMITEKMNRKETLSHTEGIELLKECIENSSLASKGILKQRISNFLKSIQQLVDRHSKDSSSYDHEAAYLNSKEYRGLNKSYNSLIFELQGLQSKE